MSWSTYGKQRSQSTLRFEPSAVRIAPQKLVDIEALRSGKAPSFFKGIPDGDPLRDIGLFFESISKIYLKPKWADVVGQTGYATKYDEQGIITETVKFKKDVYDRCVEMMNSHDPDGWYLNEINLSVKDSDKFRYKAKILGANGRHYFTVTVERFGTKKRESQEPTVALDFRVNRNDDGSATGTFTYYKQKGERLQSEMFWMQIAMGEVLKRFCESEATR